MRKTTGIIPIILLSVAFMLAFSNIALCKSQELTLDLFINAQHERYTHCHVPWIKMIEERTNGKIKITPYFANSLSPFPEKFNSTKNGLTDMAEGLAYINPGKFPISEMLLLPEMGFQTAENSAKAWWHVYETMPAMKKEYEGTKVLFFHTSPSLWIATSKPVKSLEDLKGMKIQATGSLGVKTAEALGFTPVMMTPGEVYLAIDKGVIDGCISDFEMLISRKIYEVAKNMVTNISMGHAQFYMIMNQSVWDGFPDDIKKVFEEVTGEWAVEFYGSTRDKGELESRKKAIELGVQLNEFSDADKAKADELLAPVKDGYAMELEGKGIPGKKALAEFEQFVK